MLGWIQTILIGLMQTTYGQTPGSPGGTSVLAPAGDATLVAGSSAVVNRIYTIASGKKLTLGSASIFRIL